MKQYLAALAAITTLTLGATACSQDTAGHEGMGMGGSETTASAQPALPEDVSEADVTFVRSMIPHHEQAVVMAEHVIESGDDPQVIDLAERVKDAQGPEIEMMTGWLSDWNREPASNDDDHAMDGDATTDGRMTDGMMTADQMATFDAATGPELDRLFLELMIEHHEGAIAMAETEINDGTDAAAIDLATAIATSQRTEVEEMQDLLDQLPPR